MRRDPARRLLLVAAPLTFAVIVAGAFTRLSDAGLGCPDWPACYGQLVGVPDAAAAAAHSPDWPLDERKAWIELAHRYVAGVLGLILFAAAFFAFRRRPVARAPIILAGLVIAQALLGMLTVTQQLHPAIVSAHLMGGILIFCVLAWALTEQRSAGHAIRSVTTLKFAAVAAAAALAVQILLGGWVSTNYAALSCPDFPRCQGGWLPPVLSWEGFAPFRELHLDSSGGPISAAALATIHWAHRGFAVVATLALVVLGALLWRAGLRSPAAILGALLACQIMLGIVNVAAALPLWSALLHNAFAALLSAQAARILALVFKEPATDRFD